jgi:putative hydrolases of HD superfamily
VASDRLVAQLRFLMEADRLKGVLRRSLVLGGERHENSAEHSWHVALAATVLAEHAGAEVDVARVVTMLLLHDLVEIDAGDTFVYDPVANADKADRESAAAERIFGLLPVEQGIDLRGAWTEFEARESPEARFAAALDRLLPILHNFATEGRSWQAHGVTADQVARVNAHVAESSPELWAEITRIIAESVSRGYLLPAKGEGATGS